MTLYTTRPRRFSRPRRDQTGRIPEGATSSYADTRFFREPIRRSRVYLIPGVVQAPAIATG
jgi:hypothetical protein